jgi:sigma-B regulation protein RsbU (phosphoserine phosphatase)
LDLIVDANQSTKITEVLHASFDRIGAIAETWLASGASSFSIWRDGTQVKSWNNHHSAVGPVLTAAVQIDGAVWAELRLCGPCENQGVAQIRLNSDAGVISALIQGEYEQKRLYEEIEEIQNQISVLSSISDVTRKVIRNEDLLKILAENAHRLVNADEIYFFLKIEEQEPVSQAYPQQSLGDDQVLQVIEQFQNKAEAIAFNEDQSGTLYAFGKNLFVFPLKVYEAEFAILIFVYQNKKILRPYEWKLARATADYAGTQIEKINLINIRRENSHFETEISLAQKIQQSLLISDLPKVTGLETCLAFQPASRISGDYYDVIIGYDNIVNFVIGDISGKGMPAALFMAMTLKAIRSVALTPAGAQPNEIINRTNELLYKDYNDAIMFSTIFVGQYDQRTRMLTHSNAGHSPVIYCPAGEKARMLWADSSPLGLFPDLKCQIGEIRLAAGDILLLATDGINETSNKSSRLFGFTQLMLLVEKHAHKTASEISAEILEAVKEYGAGKDQEDDRAMIVIKGV